MAGPHTWLGNTGATYGAWAADNFDTGLLPATGEDVWFTTRSQVDVTSGLDQSGPGELLNMIWIQRGNRSKIGAVGAPLIVDTEMILHQGDGALVYQQAEATVAFRYYTIDGPSASFYLAGLTSNPAGIFLRGGQTRIGPGASVGGFSIYVFNTASLVLEPHATNTYGNIVQTGGKILSYRTQAGGTTHRMSAGEFTQETTGSMEAAVMFGGYLNMKGSDIDNVHVFGGVFDFTQDPRAKSVASIIVGVGASCLRHAGITVTSLDVDFNQEVPVILP